MTTFEKKKDSGEVQGLLQVEFCPKGQETEDSISQRRWGKAYSGLLGQLDQPRPALNSEAPTCPLSQQCGAVYDTPNSMSAGGGVRLCRDMGLNNTDSFFQRVLIEPLLYTQLGGAVILMGATAHKINLWRKSGRPWRSGGGTDLIGELRGGQS